jgi:hypothetical protein
MKMCCNIFFQRLDFLPRITEVSGLTEGAKSAFFAC